MAESAIYLSYTDGIKVCSIIFAHSSGSGSLFRRTSLSWVVSAVALGADVVVLPGIEKILQEGAGGFLRDWRLGGAP